MHPWFPSTDLQLFFDSCIFIYFPQNAIVLVIKCKKKKNKKKPFMGFKGIQVMTGSRLMSSARPCSTLQCLQLGIMPSCLQRGNSSTVRCVLFKGSLQRDNNVRPTVTVNVWHLWLNHFIKSFWCVDRGAKMLLTEPTAPFHLTLPWPTGTWWERFSTYFSDSQAGWKGAETSLAASGRKMTC